MGGYQTAYRVHLINALDCTKRLPIIYCGREFGCWKWQPDNDVAVSVVTFWGIFLKYALGKLKLTGVNPEELPDFATQMNLEILPITATEASTFHKLPRLTHKDPFDCIIMWQAI